MLQVTSSWLRIYHIAIILFLFFIIYRIFEADTKFKVQQSFCRWPPLSKEMIRVNDAYNITICVHVKNSSRISNGLEEYKSTELFNGLIGIKRLTFSTLPNISHEAWKKVKYPQIYRTYPQDVPMRTIIENIKLGLPVRHVSRHAL